MTLNLGCPMQLSSYLIKYLQCQVLIYIHSYQTDTQIRITTTKQKTIQHKIIVSMCIILHIALAKNNKPQVLHFQFSINSTLQPFHLFILNCDLLPQVISLLRKTMYVMLKTNNFIVCVHIMFTQKRDPPRSIMRRLIIVMNPCILS